MTLQSQHQENTYPNNYFPPNGSAYTLPRLLSSVPRQLKEFGNNLNILFLIFLNSKFWK